jgi:hypothetical protein
VKIDDKAGPVQMQRDPRQLHEGMGTGGAEFGG